MNRYIIYSVLFLFVISSCKKEEGNNVIANIDSQEYDRYEDSLTYGGIPTILLENYVNRIYIDLLGREPFDAEMQRDVQYLRSNYIGMPYRDTLLMKLQSDTAFIEGNTSYKHAYYLWLYESLKIRLIEGVSDGYISNEAGIIYAAYVVDSVNGNMIEANKKLLMYNNLQDIIDSKMEYFHDSISINEIHRRMSFNPIYDEINMNTFNFINAIFDNLFYRYPTQYEFDECYKMIDDNSTQLLLGSSGNSKYDMTVIMCNSQEFYEGLINWTYIMLLGRQANPVERNSLMLDFVLDNDYQKIQRNIMQTDDYAHFN